jgi:predicted regulator of amino acid metabolism with ACT domain
MWNAIKNVAKAAGNIAAIAKIETQYQFSKAAEVSNNATTTLAERAEAIRATYEQNLADRKNPKPVVVPETEVPTDVVTISN